MDFRSTLALRFRRFAFVAVLGTALTAHGTAQAPPQRPFGTLRDQAAMQQQWLRKRLDTFLPSLMRKHGVDMWIVPMREYNEDPVFSALVAPETFAARRRTIYVFFDKCASSGLRSAAPRRAASSKRAVRCERRLRTSDAGSRPSCGETSSGWR